MAHTSGVTGLEWGNMNDIDIIDYTPLLCDFTILMEASMDSVDYFSQTQ